MPLLNANIRAFSSYNHPNYITHLLHLVYTHHIYTHTIHTHTHAIYTHTQTHTHTRIYIYSYRNSRNAAQNEPPLFEISLLDTCAFHQQSVFGWWWVRKDGEKKGLGAAYLSLSSCVILFSIGGWPAKGSCIRGKGCGRFWFTSLGLLSSSATNGGA